MTGLLASKENYREQQEFLLINSQTRRSDILIDSNTKIISRLIDGNFPNYKQVMPTDFDNTIVINREDFLSSLQQASIFVDEITKGVKLVFRDDKLSIFSQKGPVTPDHVIRIKPKPLILDIRNTKKEKLDNLIGKEIQKFKKNYHKYFLKNK